MRLRLVLSLPFLAPHLHLGFSNFSISASLRRLFPGFSALLIAFLVLGTTPTFGQTSGPLDVKTGLHVGATFMTIGGEDAPSDLDRRTGLMVGGFAVFDIAGPFALQPELNYIQKTISKKEPSPAARPPS